jgi:hypothetical protein
MTDELTHLHPAYRPYAVLPPEERIQWTRHDRWISLAMSAPNRSWSVSSIS